MTTEPARPTARPAVRRRRRVVAPVGRIVVAGLSASATFGLVAVMGAVADPATDGLAPAAGPDPAVGGADGARGTAPPPTTTRRRVYVIDHLPVDAPLPGDATVPGAAEVPDERPDPAATSTGQVTADPPAAGVAPATARTRRS